MKAGGWRSLAAALEAFSAELRAWAPGAEPGGESKQAHRAALQAVLGRGARAFDAVQARLDEELSRLEREAARADADMSRALEAVSELHSGAEGFLPDEAQRLQERLLSIQAAWQRLMRQDRRSSLERAQVARLWRELRDGLLPGLAAAAKGPAAGAELAALKSRFDALDSLWQGTGGAEADSRAPLEERLPRLVAAALQRTRPVLVARELRSRLDQSLAEARALRLKLALAGAETGSLREEVKELRSHASELASLRTKDSGDAEALRAAALREQWLELQETIKALREELESLKDARRVDAERSVGGVERFNREVAEARRRAEAARRAGEVEEERAAELEARLLALEREVARWRGRALDGEKRARELDKAAESSVAELEALRDVSGREMAELKARRAAELAQAQERLERLEERLAEAQAGLAGAEAARTEDLARAAAAAAASLAEALERHAAELARLRSEAAAELDEARELASRERDGLDRDFEEARSELARLKVERADAAERAGGLERELGEAREQAAKSAKAAEEAARDSKEAAAKAAREREAADAEAARTLEEVVFNAAAAIREAQD